jgi:uncharacterized membrane protein
MYTSSVIPTLHKYISLPVARGLLISAHIAGLIGLHIELLRPLFLVLVPFNLLLSAFLLFTYHPDWSRPFIVFAISTALIGYLVEVAGVATGVIFGEYTYGSTLGPKIAEVPLLIGLNWLMLIYSIGIITNKLKTNLFFKALAGSFLMVLLDLFIEQTAIRNDFWTWQSSSIPLLNYIGWFIVSFILFMLFYLLPFTKKNPLAILLFVVQLAFFIGNLFLFYI